jgi:pimeloyl-ACP methyl ester carboxylesterase
MEVVAVAKAALASAALLFLAACATAVDMRGRVASEMSRGGFIRVDAGGPAAGLLVLLRSWRPAETLTVYLEGDGAAWPGRWEAPTDPTPDRSEVLDMALADPADQVAYLARPCQYLDTAALAACPARNWTIGRFSEPVLASLDLALSELRRASGATRLRLVGYSGGGVLAALLAARREDVVQLVTVAAPLPVAAWTAHHGLTPLEGLDPDTLDGRRPPAVHFAGEKDDVVPAHILASFSRRRSERLVVVPGFDHHCCWARDWPRLLEEAR